VEENFGGGGGTVQRTLVYRFVPFPKASTEGRF